MTDFVPCPTCGVGLIPLDQVADVKRADLERLIEQGRALRMAADAILTDPPTARRTARTPAPSMADETAIDTTTTTRTTDPVEGGSGRHRRTSVLRQ
jgi:hypothetical protein